MENEDMGAKWDENDWDFDSESGEQVAEFGHIVRSKLNEVEQRMLLCLVGTEKGRTWLLNQLYK